MSAPSTPVDPAVWLAAGRQLVSMSFSTMSEVRHQADLMVFGVFDDSLDAIEAVLALHQPVQLSSAEFGGPLPQVSRHCHECNLTPAPCPTVRAITRALGVGDGALGAEIGEL